MEQILDFKFCALGKKHGSCCNLTLYHSNIIKKKNLKIMWKLEKIVNLDLEIKDDKKCSNRFTFLWFCLSDKTYCDAKGYGALVCP